jgi:hypothetical protein
MGKIWMILILVGVLVAVIYFIYSAIKTESKKPVPKKVVDENETQEEFEKRLNLAERRKRKDVIARFDILPVIKMTQEEFDEIPNTNKEPIENDFLGNDAPLGYVLICEKSKYALEMICLGHLVRGKHAFDSQYGAGLMGVPAKFLNRYNVKIVESYEGESQLDKLRNKYVEKSEEVPVNNKTHHDTEFKDPVDAIDEQK